MDKVKVFEGLLNKFETDEIRDYCADMIKEIPDYIFTIPSSTSFKYHNKTQCQPHGQSVGADPENCRAKHAKNGRKGQSLLAGEFATRCGAPGCALHLGIDMPLDQTVECGSCSGNQPDACASLRHMQPLHAGGPAGHGQHHAD